METGITSYGVYLPRYRMDRKTISAAMGWLSPGRMPGEKAVANYDEDSVTMAVAAGIRALGGGSGAEPGGVYFATTTRPYQEGEGASIIGTALGLSSKIRTADFGGSLRSGVSAMISACESVQAKGVASLLVCAADSRLGRPGSSQEMMFGDGGAAVVIGNEGALAAFRGAASVSYDFPDYRRLASEKYVHSVEERFIREEGYAKFISEAVTALFAKYGLKAEDFAKLAFPCLNPGQYMGIGKKLGFKPEQMQAQLLTSIGETGAASPLALLAGMLDEAKPGDNLLIVGYGNGAEALWLTATDRIGEARGRGQLERAMAAKKELKNYQKYLGFRGMLPIESASLSSAPATQLPLLWRERKTIQALTGSKCRKCGTPHYPPQSVCVNPECGAVNEMDDHGFADKKARLFSYTVDHISFTLNPPFLYGFLDFEGGGRFLFELTDCEEDEVQVGMPLTMSFRKKYVDNIKGVEGYFWKATPASSIE